MLYTYIRISGQNYVETFRCIQKVLEAFDPDQGTLASHNLEPLDQSTGRQYAKEDRQAKLMALYSLLAVLISTTGLLGSSCWRRATGARRSACARSSERRRLRSYGSSIDAISGSSAAVFFCPFRLPTMQSSAGNPFCLYTRSRVLDLCRCLRHRMGDYRPNGYATELSGHPRQSGPDPERITYALTFIIYY